MAILVVKCPKVKSILDKIFGQKSTYSKAGNYFIFSIDAATSSGILKAKQKLGRTFNSDKLGGIDFTKISKLTMCSA